MEKLIIYGAGQLGRRIYDDMDRPERVVCFADNNPNVQGTEYKGVPIMAPSEAFPHVAYDRVIVATIMGMKEVQRELRDVYGLSRSKIDISYAEIPLRARISFLKYFARMLKKDGISASVAEAGVFRGEFAKEINHYFPDTKLYLFDTFEGFVDKDLEEEQARSDTKESLLRNTSDYLAETSVERVLARMEHPENVIVKKGYFPDTAKDVDDEFCFVNLDLDLYQPTKEGLYFFYPRMVKGGVILIHDFFSGFYVLDQAVSEYEKETGARLARFPIGDEYSLGIIKI